MFKKIIRIIALGPFFLLVILLPALMGGLLGFGLWHVFESYLWGKILAVIAGIWQTIFGYYLMFGEEL